MKWFQRTLKQSNVNIIQGVSCYFMNEYDHWIVVSSSKALKQLSCFLLREISSKLKVNSWLILPFPNVGHKLLLEILPNFHFLSSTKTKLAIFFCHYVFNSFLIFVLAFSFCCPLPMLLPKSHSTTHPCL